MIDWALADLALRVETANIMESCGHLYWAQRLRAFPEITDAKGLGEAEDLLAEIDQALGLGNGRRAR